MPREYVIVVSGEIEARRLRAILEREGVRVIVGPVSASRELIAIAQAVVAHEEAAEERAS